MELQKGRPENTDNRLDDLQKSVPVQSSGDGFLSSSDAW